MKRFFFLSNEISYGLIIFFIFSWFKLSTGFLVFIGLVYFIIGLVFRRANIPYRDTLKNNGEIYLAPVHGEVRSIRRDITDFEELGQVHEIRVRISGWDEKGLYLPTSGEVSYLKASKGDKINRESEDYLFQQSLNNVAHTDLILTSKNQTKTMMRFIDCVYGKRPSVWLKSGDRGRGAACFGFYPFGGTLLIYLPVNSDILVFEGEHIVPGQTVIAAIKEVKEG
jgi:hypothetical protein